MAAAQALRTQLRTRQPRAMLRWDQSGRALLVSDAPRRDLETPLLSLARAEGIPCAQAGGMLYFDLPQAAYEAQLDAPFTPREGPWADAWLEEQALLAGILARPLRGGPQAPDTALLRAAVLACARPSQALRGFLRALRPADAAALCGGGTVHSIRACAALCADCLAQAYGVGLPVGRRVSLAPCPPKPFNATEEVFP